VEVVLVGLDAEAVDLDLNDVGVHAIEGGAKSLIEHGGTTSEDLRIPTSRKEREKWETRLQSHPACPGTLKS
jgi:hypothetical protein